MFVTWSGVGSLLGTTPGLLGSAGTGHNIEGLAQLAELGLAFVLSAVVGLEREVHQKSAGLRTHTLVGVGAAVFMLVSKYGFGDVLSAGTVVVDPSRVAAQIVSGIGFLGAGLIFVRRDSVRGLTTAAGIWMTAGIGACAGAGLPLIALAATGAYLIVVMGFPLLRGHLPQARFAVSTLHVCYPDGKGRLREVLEAVTSKGFSVAEMATESIERRDGGRPKVEVVLQVYGRGSVNELASQLSELEGVEAVRAVDANSAAE